MRNNKSPPAGQRVIRAKMFEYKTARQRDYEKKVDECRHRQQKIDGIRPIRCFIEDRSPFRCYVWNERVFDIWSANWCTGKYRFVGLSQRRKPVHSGILVFPPDCRRQTWRKIRRKIARTNKRVVRERKQVEEEPEANIESLCSSGKILRYIFPFPPSARRVDVYPKTKDVWGPSSSCAPHRIVYIHTRLILTRSNRYCSSSGSSFL